MTPKEIIHVEDIYPQKPKTNKYIHPNIVMIMACRGQSILYDLDFNPYEHDEFQEMQIEWDKFNQKQITNVGNPISACKDSFF